VTTCSSWQSWAPPIDPPTAGGLPADEALCIAEDWWEYDPHLCAALQWEAYAATLPPTPAVASVSTGAQSVTYNPPMPGGDYGTAMSRAAWHRSLMASLVSVPLTSPQTRLAEVVVSLPPASAVPPTAAFTWAPPAPGPNTTVTFDGSASTPGGTPIARYEWTFDTIAQILDGGPVVEWTTPGGRGTYYIRLIVYGQDEASGQLVQELTV
jgi:hypothetical protein